MSFDWSSGLPPMGDLGFGDTTGGDGGWLQNFANGDTSDTSNPQYDAYGNPTDPYNTSGSGDGYSNIDPNNPFGNMSSMGRGGQSGNPFGFSDAALMGAIPGLMQTLGGLAGYTTSTQGIDQIQGMIGKADPWGNSGGRQIAGDQLISTMGSPPTPNLPNFNISPQEVANLPGYQAGLDAIERSGAANGYLGSGNMMNSMLQYGGGMYQHEVQNRQQQFNNQQSLFNDWATRFQGLAGLSGANVAPGGNSAQLMGILGSAEASKNASLMNGLSGITNALMPNAVQQNMSQAPAQGGGGGGGGDSGLGGLGGILGAIGSIFSF